MKKTLFILLLASLVCNITVHAQSVIPQPEKIRFHEGSFSVDGSTKVYTNLSGKDRKFIVSYIHSTLFNGTFVRKDERGGNIIRLIVTGDKSLASKADTDVSLQRYTMAVSRDSITIKAPTSMGLFYGIQTLRQLYKDGHVAGVEISDGPRFMYRGLMLDCSRHFWTKEFIMKQIDALAYFKMDRLHLHLTDAGGWRVEIKKYPKLTEEGAYRTASEWPRWWESGDRRYCHERDSGAYGGFYTQKQLKEIVKYAAQRHIVVIPEIEMPGHSEEVTHAYPSVSCNGKPGDLCVGNEATFTLLEDVLKEVMKIFPSEYIHIGGDEAGRTAWETCPLCQKRMADEGLKTTAELQSYLTARIERFLNAHGRQLLGWDEILEGKLAPNAAVMSWRGEEGGIAASQAGHHVIMSPGGYCYLDHYQDAPLSQPKAIGGYLPLERVYSYDPVPDKFAGTNVAKYIDGLQGNLWTEYVTTPEHAEYMIYPRLLAISEIGWSRNRTPYHDFRLRAVSALDRMRAMEYHPFDLQSETGSRMETRQLIEHGARGKKVIYQAPYSSAYKAAGDASLTDGRRGDWDYGDGAWQGFIDRGQLDVTIDMDSVTELHDISAEYMQSVGAEIYTPSEIIISVSDDGKEFRQLDKQTYDVDKSKDYFIFKSGWQGNDHARYIRYQAHSGKYQGWIFTDEIIVNKK
jgi:hexosaminidase